MTKAFVPRVGAVFSADIAVPEHARECHFYARVLTTGDRPLWREDLTNNFGWPIIGLGAVSEDLANLPLQWMPHIQVADVGTSVQRALELGATELMHAKDGDGNSQWAVLLDPYGAAFGLVPVVQEDQIPPVNDDAALEGPGIGRIAWLDLTVPDAASARDFYSRVIGWSARDFAMEDEAGAYHDYTMLCPDGSPAAGICYARGKNRDLPPVWLLYLPVGDLKESLRRVEDEGGQAVKVVLGEDGHYVYALVKDPVGVYFALVPD